ncbi:hypothetical protein PENSPDRAFT_754962 [Peniophora sp. CONT]|nr:hypothetical protein PENSPDRAFT_754962 [Peniophora sp. CONT]
MSEPGTHATHRQSARDAWDVFLRSRFNAAVTGVDLLDVEIEVLQEQLSSARRQRNARNKACKLPAEVLTSIFMCAQTVWKPSKPRPKKPDEGDALYGAGWMVVTRVCSSWRNVALSTPSLWCDLDCLNLHPDSVMDIVSRSRALPLSLAINGSASKAELEGWLCGPVNRRIKRLVITSCPRPNLFNWIMLLYPAMPSLEALKISLATERDSNPKHRLLPAEFLAGSCPPRLMELHLQGVLCSWDSPLLSPTLTSLSLATNDVQDPLRPNKVINILVSLVNLRSLVLWNILPSDANNSDVPLPVPKGLDNVDIRSYDASLDPGIPAFLAKHGARPETGVTVAARIARPDDTIVARTISLLFKTPESARRPYDMFISRGSISISYAEPFPRRDWIIKPVRENFFRAPSGLSYFRHLDVIHPDDNTLVSKLSSLPQASLQALYVGSDAVQALGREDAWIRGFSSATNITRVAGYYVELLGLICALSVVQDGESCLENYFTLFPNLEVLVLHASMPAGIRQVVIMTDTITTTIRSATKKNHVALLELLAVRKAHGKPVKELMVDKVMASWDLWSMPALRDATKVSFF